MNSSMQKTGWPDVFDYLLHKSDIFLFQGSHWSALCSTAHVGSSYTAVSLLLNGGQNMLGYLYIGVGDCKSILPFAKKMNIKEAKT